MFLNGLDKKDNQIIELLKTDGRMTATMIGEKIGLSRTAVTNRITALEKSGVIRGYSVVLNPQKLPQMMTFITTIETMPSVFDEITEKLRNEKCVVTLCQISGECLLHAVCTAESMDEMRKFAKRMRTENAGLIRFSAHYVWDVLKGNVLPK